MDTPAEFADLIVSLYSVIDQFDGDGRLHKEIMLKLGFVASSVHSWSPVTGKEIVHSMALRDQEPGSETLQATIDEYNKKWIYLNPLPRIGYDKGLFREGVVVMRQDFISDDEWYSSKFQDSIGHITQKVNTFSVIVRNHPERIIIFNFSTDQDSAPELARLRKGLEAIAPHFVRVFRTMERLYDLEVGFKASLASMDRLRFGIVTIALDRRSIVMNSVAKMHLSDAEGLQIRNEEIFHSNPEVDRKLQDKITQAIANATEQDAEHIPPSELRLDNGLHSSLTLVAYPLRSGSNKLGDRTPVCMLLLHDVDLELINHKELFAVLYDLTPNETEVALSIANGLSLEETAEKLGHAVSTSRTVLKRVYSKTNTNRQNELAHLMLSHKDMIGD